MAGDSERKPFLLRLEPATMAALKAWAAEDLRSLNGQIEYLLRGALRDAGRLPSKRGRGRPDADSEPDLAVTPAPRPQASPRSAALGELGELAEPAGSAKSAR